MGDFGSDKSEGGERERAEPHSEKSSHSFPLAGESWLPLLVVSADAAHRSKILRRDIQRVPVLEIAGGGLLTSRAHKTAHESIAAHWSRKQIEPRVK